MLRMIHAGERCLLRTEVVFTIAQPCTPDSLYDPVFEVCFTSSARPLVGQLPLCCAMRVDGHAYSML